MKTRLLEYLQCPRCRATELKTHVLEATGEEVQNGLIVCGSCRAWYPVVDSIPIVSALPLLVEKAKKEMRRKWALEMNGMDLSSDEEVTAPRGFSSMQGDQIEHYNEEAARYDAEVTNTVFWRSVMNRTIGLWGSSEKLKQGIILDVGCGTGMTTVKLAQLGHRIVAFDISYGAVQRALAKIENLSLADQVEFVVSEAESLPFRSEIFGASVFTGVLHHVSRPHVVFKEMARVLTGGGMLYGFENNASAFRSVFDFLMKVRKIWHEEAGTHPLMVSEKVKKWGLQSGLKIRTNSIVFLPPHLLNLFSVPVSQSLLALTDRFFSWIPWVTAQGGLLIISGTKGSSA